MMMKSIGYDLDMRTSMASRMEEAMARLTLAIEEMEESKREEDQKKNMGAQWKQIAKVTDRLGKYSLLELSVNYISDF